MLSFGISSDIKGGGGLDDAESKGGQVAGWGRGGV